MGQRPAHLAQSLYATILCPHHRLNCPAATGTTQQDNSLIPQKLRDVLQYTRDATFRSTVIRGTH